MTPGPAHHDRGQNAELRHLPALSAGNYRDPIRRYARLPLREMSAEK